MKRIVKIGSRASRLAIQQAQLVMAKIEAAHPELQLELVTITTKGDRILDRTLDKVGGKGLFIKELEWALMSGEIDLAVHSYKDVPYMENETMPMVALSARANSRDVLVLPQGLRQIPDGLPIGTSSLRRRTQLPELFPKVPMAVIRGNIFTRLEKLDGGEYGALVLAACGLERMNLEARISREFTVEEMIPSASQGILAVQGRATESYDYLDCVHSQESAVISLAERSLLRCLDGGCSAAVAAHATLQGDELELLAMHVEDSGKILRSKIRGPKEDAQAMGNLLGEELKKGKVRPWR